jgi:hypothetical protein
MPNREPPPRWGQISWDFSTGPEFERHLVWMGEFVRAEIWPMFIVPVGTPGVHILRDVPTMGHPVESFGRPGGHAEIRYEGVRVGGDALAHPARLPAARRRDPERARADPAGRGPGEVRRLLDAVTANDWIRSIRLW